MTTEQQQTLKELLADAGAFGFGVCSFDASLVLPNVRSVARLPADPKSIITCVFPYYTGYHRIKNIAKYAMLPDYHKVVTPMLEEASARLSAHYQGYQFVPFIDSSPIDEVTAAVRAGVGVLGKNKMLITEEFGSYCFIGEIVTDLFIECDNQIKDCILCGRCLRACPTGALTHDGVDQALCRSAISQKKGTLSEFEQAELLAGRLIWGCDICNDVCPMNAKAKKTEIPQFIAGATPLITKENLDDVFKTSAFSWRGKAVISRNIDLLTKDRR